MDSKTTALVNIIEYEIPWGVITPTEGSKIAYNIIQSILNKGYKIISPEEVSE